MHVATGELNIGLSWYPKEKKVHGISTDLMESWTYSGDEDRNTRENVSDKPQ
jgi:hypothetical protein